MAQISVQPAHSKSDDRLHECTKTEVGGTASLDSTIKTTVSGTEVSGRRSSFNATPRAESQVSQRKYSGRTREVGSHQFSGGRRLGTFQSASSAKRFTWQGDRGLSSAGLPFQRDVDTQHSTREKRPLNSLDSECVLLGIDTNVNAEHAATCCQLCENNFNTLRAPFLLLCGHSYCGPCIDRATEKYPSALRCGVCSIVTPLGQQNVDSLPRNEAILDLVTSREFTAMVNEKNVEKCAECIHQTASVYCSECSASFCNNCAKKAHEGSRVRSKHKPVPVNLKPCSQPTCRKHPGQSCVLYCETEKQPMCVLCKFYNQHRFHK